MISVNIRRLRPDARIPSCGSAYAAGYDLYACLEGESLTIPPHMEISTEALCDGCSRSSTSLRLMA